jgi:DNA-binding GntR family transcriptional regulator
MDPLLENFAQYERSKSLTLGHNLINLTHLSARLLGRNESVAPRLRKDSVAGRLRAEIIAGRLAPGDRIIEGHWARVLGVAQASVREAINTLIQEGFVEKSAGRSARVTCLTASDIDQIYQLRAALEGLAARLTVERSADLSPLRQALDRMRHAARLQDLSAFYQHDLEFHLALCDCSGNRFLAGQVRALLLPLFAFYVTRLQLFRTNQNYWARSIAEHEAIISVLARGHAGLAEQHLIATIEQFFVETQPHEGGKLPC